MMLTRKQRVLGERLPVWYYGYAYWDFYRDIQYFYPIPINFFVRWGIRFKNHWNNWRGKPSRLDLQIQALMSRYIQKEEEKRQQRREILSIRESILLASSKKGKENDDGN